MKRWWNDTAGRLLLQLAAVLHRRVASRVAWLQWQNRRDRAIRGARRRGVPIEELATRLGLTTSWLRQVLAGRRPAEPPTVEEAV